MSFRKKHWVLGASILAASALIAGCGGSDEEEAVMEETAMQPTTPTTPTDDPPPPPMSSGEVMGDIPPTTGLLLALGPLLDENGMKMHTIEAGMTWYTPGGVAFMCPAGDADCVVTITVHDDDSITATWERAENNGGAVTAMFINPFEDMNAVSAASVSAIIRNVIGMDAVTDDTGTTDVDESLPHGARPATLGGMRSGRLGDVADSEPVAGAGATSTATATLSGAFDPTETDDSMVTAKDDDIGETMAGAIGRMNWNHMVLHSDWGDTKTPERDGGFETIGVIYSDLMAPGYVPFEDAAVTIADEDGDGDDPIIRPWFTLDATIPAQSKSLRLHRRGRYRQ